LRPKVATLIVVALLLGTCQVSASDFAAEFDSLFNELLAQKDGYGLYQLLLKTNGSAKDRISRSHDILDLYDEISFRNDSATAYCHYKLGIAYGQRNELDKSLNHLSEALARYRKVHPETHPRIFSVLWHISDKMLKAENSNVLPVIDTCLQLQWSSDRSKWSETWRYMARAQRMLGDQERFEMALEIAEPFASSPEGIYRTRAGYLLEIGRTIEAGEALEMLDSSQMDPYDMFLQGAAQEELHNYARAEEYFKMELRNRHLADSFSRAFTFVNIGNVVLRQGRLEEAVLLYQKALALNKNQRNSESYLSAQVGLAEAYLKSGDLDNASHIDDELSVILMSDALAHDLVLRTELSLLHLDNLELIYQQDKSPKNRKSLRDFTVFISNDLAVRRQQFDLQGSRQNYNRVMRRLYDRVIESLYLLWLLEPDENIAKEILITIEHNKANILLDELHRRKSRQSPIKRDRIRYLRNKLGTATNDGQKQAWSDSLALFFLENLNSPQLQDINIVREIEVESPKDIVCLHFYQGLDSVILLVAAVADEYSIVRLDPNLFLRGLQAQMSDSRDPTKKMANDSLVILSTFIRNFIPKGVDRILILPDGIINLIPGEILTGDTSHQFSISYSHSLSYLEEQEEEIYDGPLLAIAPSFDENSWEQNANYVAYTRSGVSPLLHNRGEVEAIGKILPNTRLLIDDRAIVKEFRKRLRGSSMIHLATHAIGNLDVDLEPHILFYGDDQDNNILTLSEIYNLDLSANMVVMSACETGIGEYVAGEGVMSLARGFAYAGAKSVIASLWAVDDKSTSDIMVNFYKHLKEGKPKDAALRLAKKDYLATAGPLERHPYYWAGFIAIGDMSPLDFGDNFNWIFWLFVVTVIGLLGTLMLKKGMRAS